ncbi:MAG: hypothetical protein U9Q15_03875 [Patescibacteria group bacterium]|nr:hypothetical protein [Patescibacteria group bacterium]
MHILITLLYIFVPLLSQNETVCVEAFDMQQNIEAQSVSHTEDQQQAKEALDHLVSECKIV